MLIAVYNSRQARVCCMLLQTRYTVTLCSRCAGAASGQKSPLGVSLRSEKKNIFNALYTGNTRACINEVFRPGLCRCFSGTPMVVHVINVFGYELTLHSSPRIAILRALQLGDLLCSVPAVRALRQALPERRSRCWDYPGCHFREAVRSFVQPLYSFPRLPGPA